MAGWQFRAGQIAQQEVVRLEREAKAVDLFVKYNELMREAAKEPRTKNDDLKEWTNNLAITLTESVWALTRRDSGRPFQGSTMAAGRDLSHDLMQFTVERALDIRDGFWGLLAHGAWFKSVPGRRPTSQGRAIVRAHHAALVAVEGIVNGHYLAWKRGGATPIKATLDGMYARWMAVNDGERLVLEWPIHPLPGAVVRGRPPRPARRGQGRAHIRGAV